MIFLLRTNVQLVKFVGIIQIFTFFIKTDCQIHIGLELPSEKCHKNFFQHKINNPGDHGVKSLPWLYFFGKHHDDECQIDFLNVAGNLLSFETGIGTIYSVPLIYSVLSNCSVFI